MEERPIYKQRVKVIKPSFFLVIAAFTVALPLSSHAQVVVESSGYRALDNAPWSSYTTSVDVGTSANRTFVALVRFQAGQTISSATLGGADITGGAFTFDAGGNGAPIYGFSFSPVSTGTLTLDITKTGANRGQVTWFSFSNASEASFFGQAFGRLNDTSDVSDVSATFPLGDNTVSAGDFVGVSFGSNSATINFDPASSVATAGATSQTLSTLYSGNPSLSAEYFTTTTVTGAGGTYEQAWLDLPAFNGSRPNSVAAFGFSVSAIPEPSTYAALAGFLVLGLALLRNRRFLR